jgi:hypothetical protein
MATDVRLNMSGRKKNEQAASPRLSSLALPNETHARGLLTGNSGRSMLEVG